MEDTNEICNELQKLNQAAQMAREDFYLKARTLADEVVRNKNNIGDIRNVIAGLIREYEEANERYTKAVDEATAVCQRLTKCLSEELYGGAK